jgi:hypothetical protein
MRNRWMRVAAASLVALAAVATLALPRRADAAACDWRRPDRDIQRLFPGADDYHPIYKRPFQQRDAIEAKLGYHLAGWEDLIRYYQIMKGDRRVGTIYVHLTPDGTELVVGFTNEGAVKGVVLQRYLGSGRALLESPKFLDQFVGKKLTAAFELGKDVNSPSPKLDSPVAAITLTVRKLLVFYTIYG